jgi:hypothetical protein
MDRHANKRGVGKAGFPPVFHTVRFRSALPDRER